MIYSLFIFNFLLLTGPRLNSFILLRIGPSLFSLLFFLSWAGSYSGPQSNTAFNITRWIVLRLVQISYSNIQMYLGR
jgi:hypothetical protein